MERIAFIGEGIYIYWSPIIIVLAALAAIFCYAGVYILRRGNLLALPVSILLCLCLSLPLARFIHWYCRTGIYHSFQIAMTDYSTGGFALEGVLFGCLLAACLTRLLRISKNLPKMLDAMAIGGGIGITIGRLAPLFNGTDRGMVVPEGTPFPFAYPLENVVSGITETRMATFMFQSIVTACIVFTLVIYMIWCAWKKKVIPDGDIGLIFILAYSASQIVLDSTRYDSLVLRSNGFVSMAQMISIAMLVIPMFIITFRFFKAGNYKLLGISIWVVLLAIMGLTGYMEYYVQNTREDYFFAYSVMASCLFVIVILSLVLRWLSLLPNKKTVITSDQE